MYPSMPETSDDRPKKRRGRKPDPNSKTAVRDAGRRQLRHRISSTIDPSAKSDPPPGAIDHRVRQEDIPMLIKELEKRGKPIKYNLDGSIQLTQFNHIIRTLKRKQLRIQAMDVEKAVNVVKETYAEREVTDADMRDVGRKLKEGEISMEEAKMVTLYKFERDPPYMFRTLFRDMTVDRATGLYTPSPAFHRELIDVYLNNRKVAAAAPRGHAKSTLTGFFYLMHQILFRKKRNVVLVSSTEDLAIRFLRDVKAELETNRQLIWLFGDQRTEKWSEKEIQLQNGARVVAKGRGGQLRGLKERGTRPDLIILDDLEDGELVRSDLRRMDLEDWFNGDVLPTLDPGVGQVIVVGTVLHMDSLLNRLMDPKLYPDFVSRRYSAIIDSDEGPVPLWPERFPMELLEQIKGSAMSRGQLSTFYMEYMNDPVPSEGAAFKEEMFSYFDSIPLSPFADFSREMFVDLGGGGASRDADPTAMVVVVTDRSAGTMYVDDIVNRRFGTDSKQLVDSVIATAERNRCTRVVVEKTMASNVLSSTLDREAVRRRCQFRVEYVTPNRGTADRRGKMSDGKYQRIAQMEAAVRTGEIRFRRWMTELVAQLVRFPNAQHDDLADALAYAYAYARRARKNARPQTYIPGSRRSYVNQTI